MTPSNVSKYYFHYWSKIRVNIILYVLVIKDSEKYFKAWNFCRQRRGKIHSKDKICDGNESTNSWWTIYSNFSKYEIIGELFDFVFREVMGGLIEFLTLWIKQMIKTCTYVIDYIILAYVILPSNNNWLPAGRNSVLKVMFYIIRSGRFWCRLR